MRQKHPENLRNREALADVRRGVPDRLAALFLFRSRDFSALNFTRANFHRPPGCWLFFGPQLYTHGNRRICRRSDALALFLRTEAKRREIAGKRPTLARWYQSPPGTSTPDGLAVLLRGPDALRGRGGQNRAAVCFARPRPRYFVRAVKIAGTGTICRPEVFPRRGACRFALGAWTCARV